MAGILPGILLAALFAVTIGIFTAVRPNAGPAGPKTSFKEKVVSLKNTWHVLLLFVLVMGGIYMGVFTPTEAGAAGAFGAFVIAAAGRHLTPKTILYSLKETALTSGMIMFIIASVWLFIHFLAVSKLPFAMGDFVAGLAVPRVVIFAVIVVVYIILGTALDVMSCIILTIPIVYPVILALGYDPIWFGVIVVILIEMGIVSPPEGMDVFILSGITGVPIMTIFRGVWPFCVAMVVCIIILTIFPQIALFLPNMMIAK
jgi:tripartite ATP-independent transporter DctM subunit